MIRIGITGGIGMGKSASQEILQDQGASILDTDQLARDLVAPGSAALSEIESTFGNEIIQSDGSLDRAKLADIVFKTPESRKQLEQILHPKIREQWSQQLEDWESEGKVVGYVVIPLLYETKAEEAFDEVLCIASPDHLQMERLQARGWSDNQITQRLGAQMDIREKMDRSNAVVWNSGSLNLLEHQLERHSARWASI